MSEGDPLYRKYRYAAVVMSLIAIWYAAGTLGLLSRYFIPSLNEVIAGAWQIRPPLPQQMMAPTALVVTGYGLGVAAAWILAYVTLTREVVATVLSPATDILRGIPAICYIPFFIIWFGFNPIGKIVLIQINVTLILFPALVATF